MEVTRSKDGTAIAFDRRGEGPPLILVVGAFNDRRTGAPLAEALEDGFTVVTYDRRGRGDSEDTLPYTVEREVEDLDALIAEAGGPAFVFGYSSGAAIALRSAAGGSAISKLALYEPPYVAHASGRRPPADVGTRLADLIAAGRRGDAVELFQTDVIGMPGEVVAQMRAAPFRPGLEAMAHTLVYEVALMGDYSPPTELAAAVGVSTLVIAGGESPTALQDAARAVADSIPNATTTTLDGHGHDIDPTVVAPLLVDFFAGQTLPS